MDRRLFRRWNPEEKEWELWHFVQDKSLMQCTGKRDVNDKLIFEGDIVRYNGDKYTVVWLDSMAAFAYKSVTMELRIDTFTPEIVGSIYN